MIDFLDICVLICLLIGAGCCLYALYLTLRMLRRLKKRLKGLRIDEHENL